jgi:hypothetical protein
VARNGGYKGTINTPRFVGAVGRWGVKEVYEATNSFNWPNTPPLVEYLVVAGGGGGGTADNEVEGGGGGGAGGLRTGTVALDISAGVLITVGAAGVGTGGTAFLANGTPGGQSRVGSILAAGGGGGGMARPNTPGDGGSGGGGSLSSSRAGFGNTPATTPAQGFDGRRGTDNNGGGGGGAGGVGVGSLFVAGVGVSSSISGSPVTYATGGQGGRSTNGTGSVVGTANTGQGGGGGVASGEAAGGAQQMGPGKNGGSGVVIIKLLATYPALSFVNAPGLVARPPTLSGEYIIYSFTAGSGTISF